MPHVIPGVKLCKFLKSYVTYTNKLIKVLTHCKISVNILGKKKKNPIGP